eukprot:9646219-Alexandrium_andersonii.AAC.1
MPRRAPLAFYQALLTALPRGELAQLFFPPLRAAPPSKMLKRGLPAFKFLQLYAPTRELGLRGGGTSRTRDSVPTQPWG